METNLEGKVAEIRSQYQIVINRGKDHGVEDGMRFVIYEKGEELTDPDTGTSLGNIEYVKAKVQVVYIREKYAIAETYETNKFSGLAILAGERKKLPLSEDDQSRLSSKSDSNFIVKKGDLVRQIID